MLLLSGGAASLEDLELNKTHGHEPQGKAGHDSREKHQQARDTGVDEPPGRTERDIVGLKNEVVYGHYRPSHQHHIHRRQHGASRLSRLPFRPLFSVTKEETTTARELRELITKNGTPKHSVNSIFGLVINRLCAV